MEVNICAGIVMYNPQIERLKRSLESIVPQVKQVVLVDNASGNVSDVEALIKGEKDICLIKNQENMGIAAALNQILSFAFNHSFSWALTLDQDTICPSDMINKLSRYVGLGSAGILCPAVNYEGLNLKSKVNNGDITETYACMSSGSLTNVEAWKKVGGFRDDYFIDFVDNAFCMMLRIHHYKILRVNDCIMHHQLGEAKTKKLFGILKREVCIHKPWRYYYMTRNNLLFIWEFKNHVNIIKEYLKLLYILWFGLLYADERVSTFGFVMKGVRDAIHHQTGKLSC